MKTTLTFSYIIWLGIAVGFEIKNEIVGRGLSDFVGHCWRVKLNILLPYQVGGVPSLSRPVLA